MSDQPPVVAARKYLAIVSETETYLDRYGDTYRGVGWTRTQQDVDQRYAVALDVVRTTGPVSLLDFGCGASHLLEFIERTGRQDVIYSGLDLSPRFLELSRRKFPGVTYYDIDVLQTPDALPMFDYVLLNGVFQSRGPLSFEEMLTYAETLIEVLFAKARHGLAFNVMSKHVDWERDDLFHLPLDTLAAFLVRRVTRNFIIRHDYGQYEYTTYVYR